MKIAIVTAYDSFNYGGFLQAYAMQHYLRGLGHEVVFVRRMSEEENLALFTTNRPESECSALRRVYRKVKKTLQARQLRAQYETYYRMFPYFREAWQEFTVVDRDALGDIDCILCGSDEIWNAHNAYIDPDFYACTSYGAGIPKIAVAVSSGNASYEELAARGAFTEAVRGFRTILARDELTKTNIEKLTGRTCGLVTDPTILAGKDIFRRNTERIVKEKYILVYTYKLSETEEKVIRAYAARQQLRIVTVLKEMPVADEVLYRSPLDFANLCAYAEAVYTTTFHGTIFSLYFAEHVCIRPNLPKVGEIARKLGAEEYLWTDDEEDSFRSILAAGVDRERIDAHAAALRTESDALVRKALTV